MSEDRSENSGAAGRMKQYLQKIATGPKMSKDLSEEEAEDALTLILNGSVSEVRAAIFLIAARMKLETVQENIGYWRALDKTTKKEEVKLDHLLQIADPFDGFNRVPYFGFYTIPVIAAMGVPVYGHSALPLPPKFGITYESLLQDYYKTRSDSTLDQRIRLIEEFRFGYVGTEQSHPPLENLREIREEIVKRPMLATLEKMLMPLRAKKKNYLATSYFHRGYEVSMLAVARLSLFDTTVIGNGMESCTLFGALKPSNIFISSGEAGPVERKLKSANMFSVDTAKKIAEAYETLKKETAKLDTLADMGESALKKNSGPAAPLIACQASVLCHLFGLFPDPQTGYDAAEEILAKGHIYPPLMRYLEKAGSSI